MTHRENPDEANKLLQQLSRESSIPDRNFKDQLKARMLDENQKTSLSFSFFNMKNWKIAGIFATVLIVFTVLGVSGYIVLRKGTDTTYTEVLSASERREFLGKVLKNNPQSLFSPSYSRASLLTMKTQEYQLAATNAELADDSLLPDIKEYSYSHVLTKNTLGNAVSKCPIYTSDMEGSYEYFDFIDENQQYHKFISLDKDGNLLEYIIDDVESSTEYRGGKYAVKVVYNGSVTPLPAEDTPLIDTSGGEVTDLKEDEVVEEVDVEDIGESYFGEEATVEKIVENGKVKYYVVTWKYQTSCSLDDIWNIEEDQSYMPSTTTKGIDESQQETIVTKMWFDPDMNEVLKSEEYLNSVSEDNLLLKTETDVENSNQSFEEVSDKFDFDYDVNIKTYEIDLSYPDIYTNPEEYRKYVENYLQESEMTVLLPAVTTLGSEYIFIPYGINEMQELDYLLDRDFYPEGAHGDDMYKQAKKWYDDGFMMLEPSLELSYSAGKEKYEMLYIISFTSDVDEEDILQNYVFVGDKEEKSAITVIVNGKNVAATKYIVASNIVYMQEEIIDETDEEETGASSIGEESVAPDGENSDLIYVVFEYGGMTFVISFAGIDSDTDLSTYLNFKSYNTSSKSDLAKLMAEVDKMIENMGDMMIEEGEVVPSEKAVEDEAE